MAFADIQAKTTITGFTTEQEASILTDMETAYNGSAIAKQMFDDWIATAGHTITITYVAGVYQAYTGTGRVEIDPSYITDLSYINDTGTPVLHSQLGALVHELGHALHGTRDNISATDYQGDNVKYVNTIWQQLSLDKEISYVAQARNDLHTVGYTYTDGTAIDAARTGDRNMNSSALDISNDLLIGGASANILQSGEGNDFLFGAGGNDSLYGSRGTDTAVYMGSALDYDVRRNADGTWSVKNVRGTENAGNDTLTNIEKIQFDATGGGHETYDLKKQGLTFQTDFAIVVDTTGSMGDDIASVKAVSAALVDAAFGNGTKDARFGLVSFKDTTISEPSQVILPFTDHDSFADRKTAAINAINSLSVSGGGDTPETDFDGLMMALNGSMGQWRAGAGTLRIALFTDAPAKDGYLAGAVLGVATGIGATIETHSMLAGGGGSVDTFSLSFGGASSGDAALASLETPPTDSEPYDADLPPFTLDPEEVEANPADPDAATVQIFSIYKSAFYVDPALQGISNATGGAYLNAPDNDALVNALFSVIQGNLPPTDISLSNSTIAENAMVNQVIGALSTTDPDAVDTFTYALLNNPGNLFAIDGSNLVVANPLDFETARFHNVTVQVTDSASNTHEKEFTIEVSNVLGNVIVGNSGGNTISDTQTIAGQQRATGEEDVISGKSGDDVIHGIGGDDMIYGGSGIDFIEGGNGNDTLNGDSGDDFVNGDTGNDVISGGSGNDWLGGGDGDDVINGGSGNDNIFGNEGEDTLNGGSGKDVFWFNDEPGESDPGNADIIEDFRHGFDKINLMDIDANTALQNDQAFIWGGGTTNVVANSLTWYDTGSHTIVQGDVNGDTSADFMLILVGTNLKLAAGDFYLTDGVPV